VDVAFSDLFMQQLSDGAVKLGRDLLGLVAATVWCTYVGHAYKYTWEMLIC